MMTADKIILIISAFLGIDATTSLNTEALVARNETAVVVIVGKKSGSGEEVQSSGCCVAPSGLILATAHQVENVTELRGKLKDGTEFPLTQLDLDATRDLALLKSNKPLPSAARVGDARRLRSGSMLIAITAPVHLDFSAVSGIVSSTSRTYRGQQVIQTNLPLSPGSSGGPVFDQQGNLIGIVFLRLEDVEGASIINPVNNAYDLLRKHGVTVPSVETDEPVEYAVVPAVNASQTEVRAIRAYNQGVQAQSAEEKVRFYNEALSTLPGFYEAWFNLGVTYNSADDLDRAAEAYAQAERLRPDAVEAPRNRGRVLLKQQRLDEVLKCFERARQLAPDDPSSYNDVGEAYRRLKQLDQAVAAFESALKLRPDYSAAHYNLGLTYMEMNRNRDAIAQFRGYLETNPNAPDGDQVKQLIASLDGKE
ncbi:MAG: tetratricopeptide repeat protein [Candidatus Hydrogenedentes bacterium]|nr:tetratricopeptide repeat protein [Candidatus Hydrogenedentota bacterium]